VFAVDHEQVVGVLRLCALVEPAYAGAHLVPNLVQNSSLMSYFSLGRLPFLFTSK
jgi:hypothetical protein